MLTEIDAATRIPQTVGIRRNANASTRWIESGAEDRTALVVSASRAAGVCPAHVSKDSPASIDYLINQRAKSAGLELNPKADRRTLIRRVSLDLTGLPPTREQVTAFLSDESPNAYEPD